MIFIERTRYECGAGRGGLGQRTMSGVKCFGELVKNMLDALVCCISEDLCAPNISRLILVRQDLGLGCQSV